MDLVDVQRDLRAHLATQPVPPAPGGLADRIRARHRRRRRHQVALVGVGLAAVAVFGTIPVLRSVLPDLDRSGTAIPAPAAALPSLYDLPTRGSLTDDEAWLAGVAALPWAEPHGVVQDTTPPAESHRVLYAADVAGVRVALVMGEEGEQLSAAWFTGPSGATPAQLSQATPSARALPDQPLTLLDVPAGSAEAVLVVLTRPRDAVEYTAGSTVTSAGAEEPDDVGLTVHDGVAVAAVPAPVGWGGALSVRVDRDGTEVSTSPPTFSDRAADASMAEVAVADPRGLRGQLDEHWLQSLLQTAHGRYGSGADDAEAVLLAAGPVAGLGDPRVALVGLTFRSGATQSWAVRYTTADDGSSSGETTSIEPQPAGAPLLGQTLAVRVGGAAAVSAPGTATSAALLASDGTVVTTVPLAAGSGTTELLPAPAPVAVRVRALDATGAVVAEAPVTGTAG